MQKTKNVCTVWKYTVCKLVPCFYRIRNGPHLDLEHLAEEQGSHFQKQMCCHSLDSPGGTGRQPEMEEKLQIQFVVQMEYH